MKKLLFLLFVSNSSFVFSQTNFVPGFVVTMRGDTLRGFIDYREWYQNPTIITFKKTTDANALRYSTLDLQSFTVQRAETYERFVLPMSMDENNPANIKFDAAAGVIDTVFLKVLQRGDRVTLYAYRDIIKERYFISTSGDRGPHELIYRVTRRKRDNAFNYFRVYQSQLDSVAAKFNADAATHAQIASADYTQKSLEKSCRLINGETVPSRDESAKRSTFFIGISAVYPSFNLKGNNPVLDGASVTPALTPSVAIGYDFYLNPKIRRFVIRTALSNFAFNGNMTREQREATVTHKDTYDQKYSGLLIDCDALYQFHLKATTFYVGVGLRSTLAWKTDAKLLRENFYSSGNPPTRYDYKAAPLNPWLHVVTKAGVKAGKHLDLFASYVPWQTLYSYSSAKMTMQLFEVGVNYRLINP